MPVVKMFIAAILLILVGCSKPTLAPLPQQATILAFGDSLTAGVGASEGNDYPSVLARLSGHNVINAGVSGETTAQGLARFERALQEGLPQLVVLLEGGNDVLRQLNLKQTEANLSAMLTIAAKMDVPVLLIAVPEKNLFLSPHPMYQRLAEQHQVVLLEEVLSDMLTQPELKSDSVHLNDRGYYQLAEIILRQLG